MSVIKALAQLLYAANDFAPEDDPDKYDAWRALVMSARHEFDALGAEVRRLREEREALAEENQLLTHKVITCGVAASHPDPNLSRHPKHYGGKWDSPQAEAVRKVRSERDAAREALRGLLAAAPVPFMSTSDYGEATAAARRALGGEEGAGTP
jgi:hypothetical protein